MDAIKSVSNGIFPVSDPAKIQADKGNGFMDTLKSYYNQVDQEIKSVEQKTEEFAVGKHHSLHEIMIATEKAGLSFRLLLQVRNKLLEAYQEIMRMQF